jgi:hypothetical protein
MPGKPGDPPSLFELWRDKSVGSEKRSGEIHIACQTILSSQRDQSQQMALFAHMGMPADQDDQPRMIGILYP